MEAQSQDTQEVSGSSNVAIVYAVAWRPGASGDSGGGASGGGGGDPGGGGGGGDPTGVPSGGNTQVIIAGGPAPVGGEEGSTGAASSTGSEQLTNGSSITVTPAVHTQDERFLRVQNDTGYAVTVFVQCYTRTADGSWDWLPADPKEESQGLTHELEAGETTYLGYEGHNFKGSRVRLWVQSEAGEWTEYRDKDLWLVPEVDQRGNHVY